MDFFLKHFHARERFVWVLCIKYNSNKERIVGKGLCEGTSPFCKMTEVTPDVKAFHVLDSLLVIVTGHMDLELCCSAQIAVAAFQSLLLAPVCGNRVNLSSALPLGVTAVRNSRVSLPKFSAWALGVMSVVSWLNLCTGFCQQETLTGSSWQNMSLQFLLTCSTPKYRLPWSSLQLVFWFALPYILPSLMSLPASHYSRPKTESDPGESSLMKIQDQI